jgi:hypothetical protein
MNETENQTRLRRAKEALAAARQRRIRSSDGYKAALEGRD